MQHSTSDSTADMTQLSNWRLAVVANSVPWG